MGNGGGRGYNFNIRTARNVNIRDGVKSMDTWLQSVSFDNVSGMFGVRGGTILFRCSIRRSCRVLIEREDLAALIEKVVPGGSLQIILMAMFSIFSISAIIWCNSTCRETQEKRGTIFKVWTYKRCI